MLFQSFLGLGLLAMASIAAPSGAEQAGFLAPMDMPTVQSTFDKITAGINKMVASVNAFDGDAAKLDPILADAAAIAKDVSDGARTIKGSPAMGIADVLGILGPTMSMQQKVQEIVNALNAKKAEIEKAGAVPRVVEELTKQRLAADELSASILGNLPFSSFLAPIAGPIAAGITAALDQGIVGFGGTPPPQPTAGAAAPAAAPAPKASAPAKGKGGKGGKGRWIEEREVVA
jgi:hypothetical protein